MKKIPDFHTLVKMWYAGNGEFYFVNTELKNEFSVRMRTSFKKKRSFTTISCCYIEQENAANIERQFVTVAKYILTKNSNKQEKFFLSQSDEEQSVIEMLWQIFAFLNKCITSCTQLPKSIECYYNGKCVRCGKQLITEESLKSGYGECCKIKELKVRPDIQISIPL